MGDKLRQSGTEVGALTAPHEDADQGWLARNIKSLSMGIAASAVAMLSACNPHDVGPKVTSNPDDINNFEADPGFEGCEPFKECWLVNAPGGTILVYEVPKGFQYAVEASFYGDDGEIVDVNNYYLSGEGTVEVPGVHTKKVVLKVVSPENSKEPVVITSEPVDGNI